MSKPTNPLSVARLLLTSVLRRSTEQRPPVVRSLSPQRPLPDNPNAWKAYWQTKDQPWRTEPEIDEERQKYLAERRSIKPDWKQGIYPFGGIRLSRADVEWLLDTHENGRGPVYWNDESQLIPKGLDLRGANLCRVNLQWLPFAHIRGGLTFDEWEDATLEQRDKASVHLEGADLKRTHLEGSLLCGVHMEVANLNVAYLKRASLHWGHLEGACLVGAHLEDADLGAAHLEGANLNLAHLEGVNLYSTHFEGKSIPSDDLERIWNYNTDFPAVLPPATLSAVFFDSATNLRDPILGNKKLGFVWLADVSWGNINLALINWSQLIIVGEEYEAQQPKRNGKVKDKVIRRIEYEKAVRANRQLAVALQAQGLNEDAARFAYRAQVLQRKVLWKQRNFWKWLGSAILAVLAGYGYRMWRIIAAYLIIVTACAVAYFTLGIYFTPHISLSQAFLESVMAFHGRVFYELFNPGEPQIWVTAFEAIAGLVIEGVFIAMLAQRFFGK